MTKLDFEFISTHRNRNLWPNPCLFEVPWSGSGQKTGLNAVDPVSKQAPLVKWTGENINISATVISRTADTVVVSAPVNSFSQVKNYYQGSQFNDSGNTSRIDQSLFISQSSGTDYLQLSTVNSAQIGDIVSILVTNIPNTLYVPMGSDMVNAYTGKYLYNETHGESAIITGYDSEFHKIMANIPGTWSPTDKYDIRTELPNVGNFALGAGNTTTVLNLTGIGVPVEPGSFVRIISTGEIVKITSFDSTTNLATISSPLSTSFPAGTIIELLSQTGDNYKTLSYAGTTVGQHEQVAYSINLVSAIVPNVSIKNGSGGYASDYPFLYIELFDTNNPTQNNLFSNNHSNKSYFKVTTPTGQLLDRKEKFTKFTGDLSYKTIRFRPTSNFRVVWRLPNEEEIKFIEDDTTSPQLPNEALQVSVQFNLGRN